MVGGTVLVVEHETPVRAYLEQQLADDGFEVLSTDRCTAALDLVEEMRPSLVLLDAVLPDGSGFEVCSRLREGEPGRAWDRDVPVIMVSARGDPVDRVRGFARGCDDYVVRPFVYDELVARMRAVLRRTSGPRHARLSVRDLEIDLAARIVTVGGEPVQLSAKEYELLVALAEDPERVFKKEISCATSGVSLPGAHAHARLACEPPPAQAQPLAGDGLCPERLGRGLPAHGPQLTRSGSAPPRPRQSGSSSFARWA
jgi:DNA-binding response OmpR family regulator